MSVKEILLLGNPLLYNKCDIVDNNEMGSVKSVVTDLHDTLFDFREKYKSGRAIAAPQIGVMKRIIYMHIEKPVVFINPVITFINNETFELWDDCMSFPGLLVKVCRHKTIKINYTNINGVHEEQIFSDSLSELLQHEYDHLDGILAVQRAIDKFSFALKGQQV